MKLRIETGASDPLRIQAAEGKELRVGRKADCDIHLDVRSVAPEHARLIPEADGCVVRDAGTLTGTFLKKKGKWVRVAGETRVAFPFEMRVSEGPVIRVDLESDDVLAPFSSAGPIGPSLPEIAVPENEAILVLDMCGSTTMSIENDQMALHLKQRMRALVGPLAEKGTYVGGTGDGFLVMYGSAATGLKAAKKMLERLQKRNKDTKNPPIRVRIALHFGRTYVIDKRTSDRHGGDVNTTFRIEGVKKEDFRELKRALPLEDRILCSRAFVDQYAKESQSDDLKAESCGNAALKGIPHPVEIFHVPWKS